MIKLKERQHPVLGPQQRTIPSTIHHTYKLKMTEHEQKRKTYFARLRGYRDRQ
ncbi:MAG: hypothetical protein Q4Q00_10230 [Turicibacter sp.]|nr:hypothetical protein [Turicibacter sp.]